MNRSIPLAIAAALGVLLLTSCSAEYPQGPAGKVVEKDRNSYRVGKSTITKRYLTTVTADGTRTKFRVTSTDYDRCYRGSSYPQCLKRKDRD